MTFRTRLMVTVSAGIVLSLVSLGHLIRREMNQQLTDQYVDRVSAITAMIGDQLDRESERLGTQLASLGRAIDADNRFRRALLQGGAGSDRGYILDYASDVMATTALDLFRIQNDSGLILSSGHFRNEFGGVQPGITPRADGAGGGPVLLEVGSPAGAFVALARATRIRIGTVDLVLVGGVRIDGLIERLESDPNVWIEIVYPDPGQDLAVQTSPLQRESPVPFLRSGALQPERASIVVTHSDEPLRALQELINSSILLAIGITLAATLIGSLWLVRYISRPLDELSRKTAQLDLDRLDVDFSSTRRDEVGGLSRLLGSLVDRLRASAIRVRNAERRAVTGDLARQVNHDIKNGLTPLRNVFQHLDELARTDPGRLAAVFAEREATIKSSISYLEQLASNYARLSPRFEHGPSDLNAVITRAASELQPGTAGEGGPAIGLRLDPDLAPVAGDRLVLRRIAENLVGNALDALEGGVSGGTVTIATATATVDGRRVARLDVTDTGRGMTEEELERAFEDFYTTKEQGTGLGLSVVRRLVLDLGGTLRVKTEPGGGSTFTVELPLAAQSRTQPGS